MKNKIFLISVFLLFISAFSANAEKKTIAIFDFYNVVGKTTEQGRILSLLLFAKLNAYDSFKIVERQQLEKIIKERKLNRSGLVERKYLQLAALVNADYIVTGRIYTDKDEGEIYINLKLTKCADGKIFGKSFSTPIKKDEKFLEKIAEKAAAFIDTALKKKAKIPE